MVKMSGGCSLAQGSPSLSEGARCVAYRLPMPFPAGGVVVYFPLQLGGELLEVGFARFFLCPRIMQDATAPDWIVAEIYRMNEGLKRK